MYYEITDVPKLFFITMLTMAVMVSVVMELIMVMKFKERFSISRVVSDSLYIFLIVMVSVPVAIYTLLPKPIRQPIGNALKRTTMEVEKFVKKYAVDQGKG